MRMLSFFISFVDRAMEIEMVSGRPSGMTTIINTMATMSMRQISRTVAAESSTLSSVITMSPRRKIEWLKTHTRVAFSAQSLILSAIVSSLFSKKVCCSEITKS